MATWYGDGSEQNRLRAFTEFSRGIAQRPGVYGVTPEAAAEAVRLVEVFREAMEVAGDPARKTVLATAAKNEAMRAAEQYCTRLVAFIRANPSLSDADRAAIGVPPPVIEKRRIPAPTGTPILSISGIVPGGHEMEIFDSATPGRRGKPQDTKGLELFVAYSPNHGGSPPGMDQIIKTAAPHGVLTRGLSSVIHPDERVGSVANYIGRWINRRGEAGPWSHPVRMVLAMPGGEQSPVRGQRAEAGMAIAGEAQRDAA